MTPLVQPKGNDNNCTDKEKNW